MKSRKGLLWAAILAAMGALFWWGSHPPKQPDGGTGNTPPPVSYNAWIKWGNAPTMSEKFVQHAAKFDLVAFSPGVWASRQEIMDRIHKVNPETKLGEYLTVNTFGYWMWRGATPDNYYGKLIAAIGDRWAVTTEGDTASIWKNSPMFDFMNPDVRTDFIEVVVDYAIKNRIQWFMWDYFQGRYGHYETVGYETVHGLLDLDRDGIAHYDPETGLQDDDELKLMHKVFQMYFTELRKALPDDILLIPNGNWAMQQDHFAKMADGVYVEQFPNWFFKKSDDYTQTDLEAALDPDNPKSLYMLTSKRYRKGHGWVLLGDTPPYEPWNALADTFPFCMPSFNQDGTVPLDGWPPVK